MRLLELGALVEPIMVATTQHPVMMVETGRFRLSFFCPTCAGKRSISIAVGAAREEKPSRVWKADPLPDGSPDWADRVTISPSINNAGNPHRPGGPPCRFHANITNGEIR